MPDTAESRANVAAQGGTITASPSTQGPATQGPLNPTTKPSAQNPSTPLN